MCLHLMGNKLNDSLNLVSGQVGGDVSNASSRFSIFSVPGEKAGSSAER